MRIRPVRAVVVSSILCLTLAAASAAAAQPRETRAGGSNPGVVVTSRNDDVSLRERPSAARFVKQLIRKVLIVGNADTMSTPKP
jgi:hypothetical protein